ncbi:C40 family peptidase [Streptomyces apocyni]|uniref:C40 family peptidase n=1 Tax=Streptomyces apocyni TaxID=2654677 RepID=UPI0012EA7C15|nr:C40 family peptidase [Streptomyces apocyni]
MASHRKPRNSFGPIRSTSQAVGITTAAVTSVALLSQTAYAGPPASPSTAPEPSLEEVRKKVDDLYQRAGVATQKYNAVKERTDKQRGQVDKLLDEAAQRTAKLNDTRQELGAIAAAQYRNGGASDTATLMLADDPQSYFDQRHLMSRLSGKQEKSLSDYQQLQATAAKKRGEATKSMKTLAETQGELKSSKREVQRKLSEARELLSTLTAEEKARLAALEKKREAEAREKAKELARKKAAEAERKRLAKEATAKEQKQGQEQSSNTDAGTDAGPNDDGSGGATETTPPPAATPTPTPSPDTSTDGSTTGDSTNDSYAAKAEKVIAFAEAQIGKPYVWGAQGPDSYDCSGLTGAAWKTAGVTLPRTTWDQVKFGTQVSVDDAKPGDLVFFYDDISHVGIYIGDGKMIHAPKPGTNVRTESIYYMPIHSVRRVA